MYVEREGEIERECVCDMCVERECVCVYIEKER